MSKNCPYCGRELRCIGGYYAPLFEECECEKRAREQALRESEEFRKRVLFSALPATTSGSFVRKITIRTNVAPNVGKHAP